MKKLILSVLLAASPVLMTAASYSFSTSVFDADKSTPSGTQTDSWDGLAHGQAATWGLNGALYTSMVNDVKATGNSIQWAKLTLTNIRDWTNERYDVLYVDILKGITTNDVKVVTYNSNPSSDDNVGYGKNAFVDSSGANTYNNNAHAAFNSAGAGLGFTDVDAAGAGGTANSLLRAGNGDMTATALTTATDIANMPGTYTDTWGSTSATGAYGAAAAGSTVVIWFSAANLAVLEQYLEGDNPANSPTVGLGFAAECHYYIDDIKLEVNVGKASVPDSGTTVGLLGASLLTLAALRRRFAK